MTLSLLRGGYAAGNRMSMPTVKKQMEPNSVARGLF
jgi:hypothetical protein